MSSPPQLIKQGAEAIVFKTVFLDYSLPALLKRRPKKSWRHPILDAHLRKQRLLSEARLLHRCRSAGMLCPALYDVVVENGEIWMEWINGQSVRDILKQGETIPRLGEKIGQAIAKMHSLGIIHGDLTTSNIMLNENQDVVVIDFGLGYSSMHNEDKAVDLYVLERAFSSTHPGSDDILGEILSTYQSKWKGGEMVRERLESVRLRGRKRSMIG